MSKLLVSMGVMAAWVLVASCNKGSTAETTTSSSTNVTSSGGAVSGECKFVVDAPRCQPGGKAAYCAMSHGAAPMKVAWQSFSCPDCATTGKTVKCSAFAAGDPCDGLSTTSAQCSTDGKSEFECDVTTSSWKVVPCPGGCKGDMEKGLSCN